MDWHGWHFMNGKAGLTLASTLGIPCLQPSFKKKKKKGKQTKKLKYEYQDFWIYVN